MYTVQANVALTGAMVASIRYVEVSCVDGNNCVMRDVMDGKRFRCMILYDNCCRNRTNIRRLSSQHAFH